MAAPNTTSRPYDSNAEAAARFCAATVPGRSVGPLFRAPGDCPAGKEGDALTVEFTVAGMPCLGLHGSPGMPHGMAFSLRIVTDDQAQTGRPWNALADPDRATAQRACNAMQGMTKIDIAAIEAARRG